MNRRILKITVAVLALLLAFAFCLTGCKSDDVAADLGTVKDDVAANKADATKALNEATKALEDKLKAHDTSCAAEISAVEKALEAVKNDSNEADKAIKAALEAVRSALNEATAAIESRVDANNSDLSAQIASLSAAINAVEKNGNAADSDIKAAQNALSDALDAIRAELNTAKSELGNKISENAASASKEIAALNSAIVVANKNLEAAKKAIEETHSAEMAALSSKLDSAVKTLADAISANTQAIAQLNSELKATKAELENKLDSNAVSADAEIKSLQGIIDQIKTELLNSDASLDDKYRKAVYDLTQTVNGISAKLDAYIAKNDAQIEDIKSQINDLSDKIAEAKEKLEGADATQAQKLREELMENVGKLQTLVGAAADKAELKDEIAAANKLIASLEEANEKYDAATQAGLDAYLDINKRYSYITSIYGYYATYDEGDAFNEAYNKAVYSIMRATTVEAVNAAKDEFYAHAIEFTSSYNDKHELIYDLIQNVYTAVDAGNLVDARAYVLTAFAELSALMDDGKSSVYMNENLEPVDLWDELSGTGEEGSTGAAHYYGNARYLAVYNELSSIGDRLGAENLTSEDLERIKTEIEAQRKILDTAISDGFDPDICDLAGACDKYDEVKAEFNNKYVTVKTAELNADLDNYYGKLDSILMDATGMTTLDESDIPSIAEIAAEYNRFTTSKTYLEIKLDVTSDVISPLEETFKGRLDIVVADKTTLKSLYDDACEAAALLESDALGKDTYLGSKSEYETMKDYKARLDAWKAQYNAFVELRASVYGDNEANNAAKAALVGCINEDSYTEKNEKLDNALAGLLAKAKSTWNTAKVVLAENYDAQKITSAESLNAALNAIADLYDQAPDEDGVSFIFELVAEECDDCEYTSLDDLADDVNAVNAVFCTYIENAKAKWAELYSERVKELVDGTASEALSMYDKKAIDVALTWFDTYNKVSAEYLADNGLSDLGTVEIFIEATSLSAQAQDKVEEKNNLALTIRGLVATLKNTDIKLYSTIKSDLDTIDAKVEEWKDGVQLDNSEMNTYLGLDMDLSASDLEAKRTAYNAYVEGARTAWSAVYDADESLKALIESDNTTTTADIYYKQKLDNIIDWFTTYGSDVTNAFAEENELGAVGTTETYNRVLVLLGEIDATIASKNNLAAEINTLIDAVDQKVLTITYSFKSDFDTIDAKIAEWKLGIDLDDNSYVQLTLVNETKLQAKKNAWNAYVADVKAAWNNVYTSDVSAIVALGDGYTHDVASIYDQLKIQPALDWFTTYNATTITEAFNTANGIDGIGTDVIYNSLVYASQLSKIKGTNANTTATNINNRIDALAALEVNLTNGIGTEGTSIKTAIDAWAAIVDEDSELNDSLTLVFVNRTKYTQTMAAYNSHLATATEAWNAVYTTRMENIIEHGETYAWSVYDFREINGLLAWYETYGTKETSIPALADMGVTIGSSERYGMADSIKTAIANTVSDKNSRLEAINSQVTVVVGSEMKLGSGIEDEINTLEEMIATWKLGLRLTDADADENAYIGLNVTLNTAYEATKTELAALLTAAQNSWSTLYTDRVKALVERTAIDLSIYDYSAINAAYGWFATYGEPTASQAAEYEYTGIGTVEIKDDLDVLLSNIRAKVRAKNTLLEEINTLITNVSDDEITLKSNVKSDLDEIASKIANWKSGLDLTDTDTNNLVTLHTNLDETTYQNKRNAYNAYLAEAQNAWDLAYTERLADLVAGTEDVNIYDKKAIDTALAWFVTYGHEVSAIYAVENGLGDVGTTEIYNALMGLKTSIETTVSNKNTEMAAIQARIDALPTNITLADETEISAIEAAITAWATGIDLDSEENDYIELVLPARAKLDAAKQTINNLHVSLDEINSNIEELVVPSLGSNYSAPYFASEDAYNSYNAEINGITAKINAFTTANGSISLDDTVSAKWESAKLVLEKYSAAMTIKERYDYTCKYVVNNTTLTDLENTYNNYIVLLDAKTTSDDITATITNANNAFETLAHDVSNTVENTEPGSGEMNGAHYDRDATFNVDTGVTMGGTYASSDKVRALFAENGARVTIAGGLFDGGSGASGNVAIQANGTDTSITIRDGIFTTGADCDGNGNSVVYAKNGATITIEGGVYRTDYAYNGVYYVLNCQNGSDSAIIVKGGMFYKFNPAKAKDASSSYYVGDGNVSVAPGYHVEQEGDWFTVVPDINGETYANGSYTINTTVDMNGEYRDKDIVRAVYATGAETALTLTGGTYNGGSGAGGNVALQASNGANVTITDGEFTTGADCNGLGNSVIYATSGATITIEGGTYRTDYAYNGVYYVLNCKNGSDAAIIVKGGSFYKFDPSKAGMPESGHYVGDSNISIAEGYHVEQNGDWYTVVAE